jgi:hypothetical protein
MEKIMESIAMYSSYRPPISEDLSKLEELDILYERIETFLKCNIKPCSVRQQCLFRLLESQLIAREVFKGLDLTDEANIS